MKPCEVVGEQPAGAADQREIDHKHHHRMPDHEVGGGRVAVRQAIEDAVEQRGEAVPAARDDVPARRRTFLLVRSKDLRGQCRRQRQRAEAGDRGRDRNGDGELLEELSGNAAQEGCRHEHRAEHQRDRDQRAADLLHGLERRLAPAHTELEMSLDILDHHDGVVDHDADREDQTEQRQIIDRESERGHHREGADQRHRDRDDRDDRRPPPLQKHQHHDDDERHRLVDRLDQLMDRLGDEFGGVVADIVVEPLREARLELRHRVGDMLRGGERVRSGPLRHHHCDGRLAQEEAAGGVGQRTELDAGNVAQPHGTAVGAGLHHDVLELPDIFEAASEDEVRLECAIGNRRLRDLSARDLQVLRADRCQHLARCQTDIGDPVGIEPQPHRVVARAEHLDVADAVEPQKLIADLQRRVVGDVELIERVVGRQHEHDHQDVGRVLAGDDAVALHLLGQPRLRDRDAILHQHLGLVEVGAELEGDGDGELAVRGRLAVDIQHVLDAVDLLLDRGGDGVGYGLRRGARILRGDGNGRRHHLRIFRDRQRLVGDRADNQEHDRQHHRKDGLVDGKPSEIHGLAPAGLSPAGACRLPAPAPFSVSPCRRRGHAAARRLMT